MSLLLCCLDQIIVSANDKLFHFNTTTKTSTELCIPLIEVPATLTKNQQEAMKNEKSTILTFCFSKCGVYIAVCCANKQFVVFERLKVLKNVSVFPRAVSKIRFTPNLDIVVADKTGDVYVYNLLRGGEPTQLLGHLSMLLDVIMTDDSKYIVTCDRDEKIRVSSYPGAYNIKSFCLGHDEFVLNLEFLNNKVLTSSSGDGTIRFWDFLQGKELKTIRTNENITDLSILDRFTKYMDGETIEVNALPITNLKILNNKEYTLIIVSIFKVNEIQVYSITNSNLNIEFLQNITLNTSNIISFDVSDNQLYVLTNTTLHTYNFINTRKKFVSLCRNDEIDQYYTLFSKYVNNCETSDLYVLYKRKYDNVQEYQERKKMRIEGCNKK